MTGFGLPIGQKAKKATETLMQARRSGINGGLYNDYESNNLFDHIVQMPWAQRALADTIPPIDNQDGSYSTLRTAGTTLLLEKGPEENLYGVFVYPTIRLIDGELRQLSDDPDESGISEAVKYALDQGDLFEIGRSTDPDTIQTMQRQSNDVARKLSDHIGKTLKR